MGTNDPEKTILRFGAFELDPGTGELFRGGVRRKIQPQPFKVLTLLASQPGQLFTREELQEEIWGTGNLVDAEHGLNFCIKEIRAVLGDDAQSPRFVETLPRRGYRFIAPVEQVGQGTQRATLPIEQPATSRFNAQIMRAVITALSLIAVAAIGHIAWEQIPTRRAAPGHRILLAVLPFDDLSPDGGQEHFADGVTDEMITQLARLQPQRLGIIARTSTVPYKGSEKGIGQIARELGVDFVLEGTVRRVDGAVRITAQLIHAHDESHVWAGIYDGEFRDILDLQAEAAHVVAKEIATKLTPSPGTRHSNQGVDPRPHGANPHGRYY